MNLSTFRQLKERPSHSMVVPDDQTLEQVKRIMLGIFDDIRTFCEEQGISYVLSGGSALGAIRHGGFIPWDDDMDVNMPRADYDRFVELFPQKFEDKYLLQSPELTPQAGIAVSRVRLRGTTMRMHDDCAMDDCGIFVDIFPIENTYNNPVGRNLHGFACMATGFLYSCRRFFRDRQFYLELSEQNPSLRRVVLVKSAIGAPTAVLSMERWSKIVRDVYACCKNDQSTYVAVPAGIAHFYGELCRRDQFCDTRKAEFEGRTVCVPKDAEGYLEMHYGDWHRIPAPEERERHAYLDLDLGPYALEE